MSYTLAELAREAERETKYRRWVYSRMVGEGKMKLDDAERRIAMMEAIQVHLAAEAEQQAPQGRLF